MTQPQRPMAPSWSVALLACSLLLSSQMPLSAAEPDGVSLPAKENFHLFLLAGQSNMAGRGRVGDADRQPHQRVLMLTQENRWVPAADPLHFDKPSVVGTGPGKSFAVELANADPEITIGLIPCAVGGSPIASWEPEGYHEQTKSHPWDDCLKRSRIAMQSGTLKGILWHQGESDAQPGLAEVYEEKLHALIRRFRKELDSPEVPFLAGQLGQFEERPWSEAKKQVDAAHRSLPEKVPHTAFVPSDGLKHKGDKIHFDAESCREFGRRYAQAYRELISTPNEPPTP
jgi:hypothetical protein